MIVRTDSPLRQLPASLNRKQTLFLDGVRVAADSVDLAYSRLTNTLGRLATGAGVDPMLAMEIAQAVQDVWSIVDSTHRLRALFARMPGVKQRGPCLQAFYRATADIKTLRHVVQHLDSEIDNLVKLGVPLWGTIHWLVADPSSTKVKSCLLAAGTTFSASHPVQNPIGIVMRDNLDHVLLRAGDTTVAITEAVLHVARVVKSLEHELAPQFVDLPKQGADAVFVLEIEEVAESTDHPPVSGPPTPG